MHAMFWFTVVVGGLVGLGIAVYIVAMHHFFPDQPPKDPQPPK